MPTVDQRISLLADVVVFIQGVIVKHSVDLRWSALLLVCLAAPAGAADTYCGTVDGRFVSNCPKSEAEKSHESAGPRGRECDRLNRELAAMAGMSSFAATMKKDDLQKLISRRCVAGMQEKGNTPACDQIADELYSLVGTQVQTSLVKKTDLRRQYDNQCGTPPSRPTPAIVITR